MAKTQLNLFDDLSEKFQKKLKKITHKTPKNKDNLSLKGWLLSYNNDEEPLTNKNVYNKVIGFTHEFLDNYDLPGKTEIKFDRLRNASYIDNTFENLDSADVALNVEFQTLSGVKVRAEMTVPVKNGEFVEPSILFIDGNSRIISQTTLDDITKKGTFTRKMFKNPEDIVTSDMLKTYQDVELPVINLGMYSASKDIMDKVAENHLDKKVDDRIQLIKYGTPELNAVNKYAIAYENKIAKTNQNWNYDDLYDYVIAGIKKEGMSIDGYSLTGLISKVLFRSNQDTYKEVKTEKKQAEEQKEYLVTVLIDDSVELETNVWADSEIEAMDKADELIRERDVKYEDSVIDVIRVIEASKKQAEEHQAKDIKYFSWIKKNYPEDYKYFESIPAGEEGRFYNESQEFVRKKLTEILGTDEIHSGGDGYTFSYIEYYGSPRNKTFENPDALITYVRKLKSDIAKSTYVSANTVSNKKESQINEEDITITPTREGFLYEYRTPEDIVIKQHYIGYEDKEEMMSMFLDYIKEEEEQKYGLEAIKESKVSMTELLADKEKKESKTSYLVMDEKAKKQLSNLYRDIDKAKSKLKKMPIVENFGQDEVEKLKDKYRDYLLYEEIERAIQLFDDWASGYTGNKESNQIEFYKFKKATGEPDQDYDHAFFDEIVRQLEEAGFSGATHKEFDKYQGVYLKVPGVDTFWIKDIYYTGEKAEEDRGTFTYKPGTETEVYVFTPEDVFEDVPVELEVINKDGIVDASELIEYCKPFFEEGSSDILVSSNKKQADLTPKSKLIRIRERTNLQGEQYLFRDFGVDKDSTTVTIAQLMTEGDVRLAKTEAFDTMIAENSNGNISDAIIESEDEYRIAFAEVEKLISLDPEPETIEGKRLDVLAKLVEEYEKKAFDFYAEKNKSGYISEDRTEGRPPTKDNLAGGSSEELNDAIVGDKKELKWVYGTKDEKWHLVGPEDRDYAEGIPQEEFKELGEEKAKEKYLSPTILKGKKAEEETESSIPAFVEAYMEDNPTYDIITHGEDWLLAKEQKTNKAIYAYGFDDEGYYEFNLLSEVGEDYQEAFKNAIKENNLTVELFEDEKNYYETLIDAVILSGKQALWKDNLQNVYESLEEFKQYDEMYGLIERLGFDAAEDAWEANPMIQGTVYPEDYTVVEEEDNKIGSLRTKSETEYRTLLAEVEKLISLDPEPETDEGKRLDLLASQIEDYEKKYFPITSEEKRGGEVKDRRGE